MAAVNQGRRVLKRLIGRVLPCTKENAVKVRIITHVYDAHLHMHFPEYSFIFAHDTLKCKSGDMILIQELEQKMTRLISHKVLEVIHPCGDIEDPITGKKVVGERYRDEIDRTNKLYGVSPNAFNYESRPPRGVQENKRDWTNNPGIQKWNEDPKYTPPHAI